MKRGYVYIMTDAPSGTLYIGVTSVIAVRVAQHRNGTGSAFCRKHGTKRLVHVERYDAIGEALVREKQLKAWKRGWKLNLIGRSNPGGTTCSGRCNWSDERRTSGFAGVTEGEELRPV